MAPPYQTLELGAKTGTCSLSATENYVYLFAWSATHMVHWDAYSRT